MYAFSYSDYIDSQHTFVARMPMYYAFRDAFGLLDVVEDSKATLRGEGMDYREFEPAEGFMHQGDGRDRRIRAGLRYSKGGQRKYWLPKTIEETRSGGLGERAVNRTIGKMTGRGDEIEDVHAPLLAQDVVHLAPDLRPDADEEASVWPNAEVENGYELPFGDLDEGDEELFAHSLKYLFGDYNYPCIDVSSESARIFIWDEEERILRDERGAWYSSIRGAKGQAAIQKRERPAWEGYGAVGHSSQKREGKGSKTSSGFYDDEHTGDRLIDHDSDRTAIPAQATDVIMKWTNSHLASDGRSSIGSGSSPKNNNHFSNRIQVRSSPIRSRHNSRTSDHPPPSTLPPDAVDLVVEDPHAAEEEQIHERRKGEMTRASSHLKKVYRSDVEVEEKSASSRSDGEETTLHGYGSGSDQGGGPTGSDFTQTRVIARESTPPLHVRAHAYDIPDDDNPWA